MTPDEIDLAVSATNGKITRLVIARHGDVELFRGNVDTNSDISRRRVAKEIVKKTSIDVGVLFDNLDNRLVTLADERDAEAIAEAAAEQQEREAKLHQQESIDNRPRLMLPGQACTITEAASQLGKWLADAGKFYLRGGVPMRAANVDGDVRLEPLRPAALCSDAESVAKVVRYKETDDGAVAIGAVLSEPTARQILESQAFREQLPKITVLSRCAVLIERGGELATITNYDPESGILAMGTAPPLVPLEDAIAMLRGLLDDFNFVSEGDRSRALAAMITPALVFGGLLGGRAPIDAGESDKSQAGKGFRHRVTAAIYRCVLRTIAQRERGVGSIQETFDAALVAGACFISWDNLRGKLEVAGLESFLTEPLYYARIPYASPMEIDATTVIVQLTTNKCELTIDLANRSSITRIKKQPEGYKFHDFPDGGLYEHVLANQPLYLGAVFTVIREWHRQGKPRLESAGHDFRAWAGALGWIVANIFKAAPLMEEHREIQDRVASPGGNWLRDLTLAIVEEGKVGEWLRPKRLLDVVLDRGIETPGLGADIDLEDHVQFLNATRVLGRWLKRVMTADTTVIDGVTIERQARTDSQGRDTTEYRFSESAQVLATQQPRNHPECHPESNPENPEYPECAGHLLRTPDSPCVPVDSERIKEEYKGVAPLRGIRGKWTRTDRKSLWRNTPRMPPWRRGGNMEVLTLLAEARAAGLTVAADGDTLVVRGPRRLAALARRLGKHKRAVLAVLAKRAPRAERKPLQLIGCGFPARPPPVVDPRVIATPKVICPRCNRLPVLPELAHMTKGLCYQCWESGNPRPT